MKEFIKKNFAILLAFILPIALITIVALSTYLPSLFLSTDYDFVYTLCTAGRSYYSSRCDDYLLDYLQKRYSVVDNKLVLNPVAITENADKNGVLDLEKYTDRIFLHDTKKNESREITLEEAQTLPLSGLLTSPDGVTVSGRYDRRGGGFFFVFDGGSSSYDYYLTKGKSRSKLNLINSTDQYYYQNNLQFIGWILVGRS